MINFWHIFIYSARFWYIKNIFRFPIDALKSPRDKRSITPQNLAHLVKSPFRKLDLLEHLSRKYYKFLTNLRIFPKSTKKFFYGGVGRGGRKKFFLCLTNWLHHVLSFCGLEWHREAMLFAFCDQNWGGVWPGCDVSKIWTNRFFPSTLPWVCMWKMSKLLYSLSDKNLGLGLKNYFLNSECGKALRGGLGIKFFYGGVGRGGRKKFFLCLSNWLHHVLSFCGLE